MAGYNLYSLIHRDLEYKMSVPTGEIISRMLQCEIPIRIPKIQRDYAEGRETEMIERKRHSLLNDMLDVVFGVRNDLSFDFVYGYMIDNGISCSIKDWNDYDSHPNVAFEPLDGQQRLTTLFLLYWLFGRKNDIINSKNNHSLFVYETRDTSEEFCNWLVEREAKCIIDDWEKTVKEISDRNKKHKALWNTEKDSQGNIDPIVNRLHYPVTPVPTLFDYFESIETFKWDWRDDPNIRSMIVVLESAVQLINERGLDYQTGITNNKNLDNISFMLLDDLNCDGDQLFEKMNARGKALTSFEILKSSLEEEMEWQKIPNTDQKLSNDWRTAIDNKWIDYCWDNFLVGNSPKLETVRGVETKLERLIVRMATKSFYKQFTNIKSTMTTTDAVDYGAQLRDSIARNEFSYDVVNRYLVFARHERDLRTPQFVQLDFSLIYEDFDHLLYKDKTGRWHDASQMLPKYYRNSDDTLLRSFMADSPTHNVRVMIYAMLAYLCIVPAQQVYDDPTEKANFIDWMRFVRNVFNPDNKNSGLDNFNDVLSSIAAVDIWLDAYKNSYRMGGNQDVLSLIANFIVANPSSQEKDRLEEEAIKARLRMKGEGSVPAKDWEDSILKAEENYYLWGQIIAPLSWSRINGTYDKRLFDNYIDRLNIFFNKNYKLDDESDDALFIQVMLCLQDYRHNCKNNLGSLGRFNNDRDHSWKQYLRKLDTATGFYGSLFKDLIDEWIIPANIRLSFTDFLKQKLLASKGKYTITDWQYYIVNIKDPKNLLQLFWDIRTYGRYLYNEPQGHAYLFRSDTQKTANRYELLTAYLGYEKSLLQPGITTSDVAHTADPLGAHIDFTLSNGDIVRLSPGDQTFYNIEEQKNGANGFACIHQNIDVANVEIELKNLGVIKSL